jgi:NAD(P)-dependent dehydrogenase (short-subunit alcohol dehydrogenase family)
MSLPKFSFEGKRVVVTGAASGMGKAAAELLVEDGADVYALDVQKTDVSGVTAFEVDLRDSSAIRDFVSGLPQEIDVLTNFAGLANLPDPVDVARVNFIGLRRLSEEIIPRMSAGSSIGNVASKSGGFWPSALDDILPLLEITDDGLAAEWFASNPRMADKYGFTKACVVIYTLARAAELAPLGIRMNAISPGASDTGFFGAMNPLENPSLLRSISHIGRMSDPSEQAYALLFLCSDAASYISGVNVIVDGGAQGGYITGRIEPPDLPPYKDIRRPPAQFA